MLVQIKDNSTLAKLLATEDIHVTYKNARTASFDVKTRELVIPIMKEMSKDIQDLMTLHEVGHALFTSLDMLQESIKRKLDHSFVNVIEDVRIEKAIQNKYRGSKSAFKRGYQDLIGMDFFETNGKDINNDEDIVEASIAVAGSDLEMKQLKNKNDTAICVRGKDNFKF